MPDFLPQQFLDWFAARGWSPRPHQHALLEKARLRQSVLLVAPTGAGKTLAGFLPSLVELSQRPRTRKLPGAKERAPSPLHTLYISPLKALTVDIARNLEAPVRDMNLPVNVETRTGDTSASKRQRQRTSPPDILLTTPEQLALLLAHREARPMFENLQRIIVDELHSLVTSKRGDLLALDLARLRRIAPGATSIGLSATVRAPEQLQQWLADAQGAEPAALVMLKGGAQADLSILKTSAPLPIAGHTAHYAYGEIYSAIKAHRMTLLFVNTRMQAEFLFQELWGINEDHLPIALHHGSLDATQRRKVEAAMAAGKLRAVVCTSTLDLGIDWGDVDLVVNLGAPKGASRLMQRVGRANHRLDEPSKALLVPSNRFEAMECRAALQAVAVAAQDTPDVKAGGLDVLAQHVLGMACAEAFDADALYREIISALPYAALDRKTFDDILHFSATGGYALKSYDRFAKIRQGKDGLWRISTPQAAQRYRMNIGTIVEATMLKVRLGRIRTRAAGAAGGKIAMGGRVLGEVEEYFAEQLTPGDTFIFAGEILQFLGLQENEVIVTRARAGTDPKIPSYDGGKFPLSTFLAGNVRAIIADARQWKRLPPEVQGWLQLQKRKSVIPGRSDMLVETFPRGGKHYLVAFPFEGRLAHQTLGMLLTRRLERLRMRPLGFVCNDYGFAIWGLADLTAAIAQNRLSLSALFSQDMLGDDLEDWLAESSIMKRTFRHCAIIAGLIERRFPGQEKTGRQMTLSTDLIYDVLRKHEPDHILLRASRADAASGLLDIRRVSDLLARIRGHILHRPLERVSPLGISVMLEIGRESVYGEASDALLAEAEAQLSAEALI